MAGAVVYGAHRAWRKRVSAHPAGLLFPVRRTTACRALTGIETDISAAQFHLSWSVPSASSGQALARPPVLSGRARTPVSPPACPDLFHLRGPSGHLFRLLLLP